MDETGEFHEMVRKYILNVMRDYSQCFITIMAYNLMVSCDNELKIFNLIDDWLGHLVSFITIASMNSWTNTWNGIAMVWNNKGPREVVMSTMGGSVSLSRCSLYRHLLDTNIQHPRSLDNQFSIPISMTTGAYNVVSFWQVKADTRALQIVRWVMWVCTTSGENNQTSTRC